MKNGDIITFDAKKNFKYIKPLGQGGTGDTHLFLDETTNIQFAIKKYVPKDMVYIDDYYERFVDEIKILFNISHPNIVRIYNYYLFPVAKTGFLQMEYIDGESIDKYDPDLWQKDWNDVFREVISAFEYLEKNHILHRDIRPANIMINKNQEVKIIDFGFGKQVECSDDRENSICLNWPATEMPDEVLKDRSYDHKTEIFFVGTLFKHLIKDLGNDEFHFFHIVEQMTQINPENRYNTFSEIRNDISSGILSQIRFTEIEKIIYQKFASDLHSHIICYYDNYKLINNIGYTFLHLSDLIRNSTLEEYIQNNNQLIECFIGGEYQYESKKDIKTETVIDFYKLIQSLSESKQNILFDNINTRLESISIHVTEDEIPF